jgi:hypothetical protein
LESLPGVECQQTFQDKEWSLEKTHDVTTSELLKVCYSTYVNIVLVLCLHELKNDACAFPSLFSCLNVWVPITLTTYKLKTSNNGSLIKEQRAQYDHYEGDTRDSLIEVGGGGKDGGS